MDTSRRKVFYPKLRYVFIEIPKFNKQENELRSNQERWLYVLANLAGLREKPVSFTGDLFNNFFKTAEVTRMSFDEQLEYLRREKAELDYYNTIKYAKKQAVMEGLAEGRAMGLAEGRAKGLVEGKAEGKAEAERMMVLRMQERIGMSPVEITRLTGLDEDYIRSILNQSAG